MDVILSTRNSSKAEQIRAIFAGSSVTVLTLDDVGIEGEAVEDGLTLHENALKKALFAFEQSGKNHWVMADDTGIFIDALGGEPGVRSARWAGEHATTEEIMHRTLDRLKGIADRYATFETTVAVVGPGTARPIFRGKVRGRLLEAPRRPPQPKMPYSSIFVPSGFHRVWAEMTTDEENAISHRGQAFRKARDFLERMEA